MGVEKPMKFIVWGLTLIVCGLTLAVLVNMVCVAAVTYFYLTGGLAP
jgi:hypothetical protein